MRRFGATRSYAVSHTTSLSSSVRTAAPVPASNTPIAAQSSPAAPLCRPATSYCVMQNTPAKLGTACALTKQKCTRRGAAARERRTLRRASDPLVTARRHFYDTSLTGPAYIWQYAMLLVLLIVAKLRMMSAWKAAATRRATPASGTLRWQHNAASNCRAKPWPLSAAPNDDDAASRLFRCTPRTNPRRVRPRCPAPAAPTERRRSTQPEPN